MEINSMDSFLRYYSRIKQRTRRLFEYIPPDKIEWTYQEGKFTIGDIIRHLANIERFLYAENIQLHKSKYRGCGIEYADGLENVIQYYDDMHEESKAIFRKFSDEDVKRKCKTPVGTEITIWKWLRAMVEHEVHHRGQLYMYLGILGIKTPSLFGLTAEEVIEKSEI